MSLDISSPTNPDADTISQLSAELIRHNRLSQALRALMAAWAPGNLDWGATTLLALMVKGGPQRQGELADCALLDPSTVSRRVGQLVQQGYVERRADPADGRAIQLVATDAGQAVFAGIARRREAVMREMLLRWPQEDVDELVRLLGRLNDDVEQYRPVLQRTSASDPVPPFPEYPSTTLSNGSGSADGIDKEPA